LKQHELLPQLLF